jgi:hypothetical protein
VDLVVRHYRQEDVFLMTSSPVWVIFCKQCDLKFSSSKGELVEMRGRPHKIKLICPFCLHSDTYGIEDLLRCLYSSKMAS